MHSKDIQIGIIGGSIAGCASAVALIHRDFSVQIFERSKVSLIDRGAGICLPPELVKECIANDLFDKQIPYHELKSRTFYIKTQKDEPLGKPIWRQPIISNAFNWASIYENLRRRVPDECYHANCKVTSLMQAHDKVKLHLDNGTVQEFDYVICADGYRSLGRHQIYPDLRPAYTDYVVWRGIIPKKLVANPKTFMHEIPYYLFENGHAVFYFIPAEKEEDLMLNWVIYEDRHALGTKSLFVDKTGKQHAGSLASGLLTQENIAHLHTFAKRVLPEYVAELICKTEQPFLQAVYDFILPSNYHNRIIFCGDANAVLRPHIGSGATKALQEAIALGKYVHKDKSIATGLAEWDKERHAECQRLLELGKTMGNAMVLHTPDWQSMDEQSLQHWWSDLMAGKKWYATDSK